jgi:hypothetical protein
VYSRDTGRGNSREGGGAPAPRAAPWPRVRGSPAAPRRHRRRLPRGRRYLLPARSGSVAAAAAACTMRRGGRLVISRVRSAGCSVRCEVRGTHVVVSSISAFCSTAHSPLCACEGSPCQRSQRRPASGTVRLRSAAATHVDLQVVADAAALRDRLAALCRRVEPGANGTERVKAAGIAACTSIRVWKIDWPETHAGQEHRDS